MRTLTTFVLKHWLTLGLLAASVVFVVWIVQTQRPPGAMTLVEAQAMDMTAMKPPPGVFPVAAEEVLQRTVGEMATYPAEVLAYSDEDVVARVMGQVNRVLAYPGDRVKAGQLLATINADEYAAMAGESRLMAAAKSNMALASRREIEERRAMLAKAKAEINTALASVARSEADAEAMSAERRKSQRERDMAKADVDQMQAELRYAEQEYARSQKLHKQGAISLDELQAAQRERDASAAKVRGAESKTLAAEEGVRVAEKRVNAALKMVEESKSMVVSARSEQAQAEAAVRRASAEARGASAEAQSAKSGASGTATMADYRNLRALSDGEVSERMVSPGTSVMPGMVVLRLKVVDRVRVQAELPQSLSARVQLGTPIHVQAEGIHKEASVTSVFPTVTPDSRTFRIEAVVENRDRALKPGMFLTVSVGFSEGADGMAVRSSAIQKDADGGAYVWVLKEKKDDAKATDWTCTMHPEISMPGPGLCPKCKMDLVPREGSGKFVVEKRKVTLGASDGEHTAILSGLEQADQVVWAGLEDLYPGAPVQPMDWGTNGPKELPATGGAPSGHEGHTPESAGEAPKTAPPSTAPSGNDMPGMDMGGKR